MDNKNIKDIIGKFGEYEPGEEEVILIGNLYNDYQDKSDDEIFVEIIKANSIIEEKMTEEQYKKIFDKLESIRPVLNAGQNEKLDKVLEMLNKEKE